MLTEKRQTNNEQQKRSRRQKSNDLFRHLRTLLQQFRTVLLIALQIIIIISSWHDRRMIEDGPTAVPTYERSL